MRAVALCLTILLAVACGDNVRSSVVIISAERFAPVLGEFVELSGTETIALRDQAGANDIAITVAEDASIPAEGYRLQAAGTGLTVTASDILGAQYGTSAALEALGYRWRHPFDPYVPGAPQRAAVSSEVHQPEIRVRGFQLHTLHPIEGYFAFWEPSPTNARDAKRIIDWLIKNRGNFLQWVALDDILDPAKHAAWKEHTAELVAYAHARGIRVGLNIQMFGQANLQQAFDLYDDETRPFAEEIAERIPLVTDGLPFDVFDLSFGEFFNADPAQFVASLNEVQRQFAEKAPQAELHAFVHVGAEQRIDYMNENLIYYFLVKFAHPAIIPDIHTVMFYNLYEPAHGAYHHEDFSEHAAYLEQRICEGKPAAYIPETAYWVAFDVSVPYFMPLYVRNRWFDLAELKKRVGSTCGPLDNHTVFQTAWEWGYWLHDVTVMRASYELPTSYVELLEEALSPDLTAAVAPVADLIELQREYLMSKELVQYIAGRDIAIDAGRALGIVSQPDRVTFDDLSKGADRAAFRTNVLEPLIAYADALDGIARRLDRANLPASRWGDEIRQGIAVDVERTRFAIAVYSAMLAHLDGDEAARTTSLETARARLADAGEIVKARHGDLHDDHDRQLLDLANVATFYPYGYLYMADTLCYWRRELVEVENLTGLSTTPIPDCLYK